MNKLILKLIIKNIYKKNLIFNFEKKRIKFFFNER